MVTKRGLRDGADMYDRMVMRLMSSIIDDRDLLKTAEMDTGAGIRQSSLDLLRLAIQARKAAADSIRLDRQLHKERGGE